MTTAHQTFATRSHLHQPGASFCRRVVSAAIGWLVLCAEVARQRRALAMLDDRLLRDIGLTRDDVAQATAKPFWYL